MSLLDGILGQIGGSSQVTQLAERFGLSEEQVQKEAKRCLSCGATTVDLNRCIGCGLCTTRCEFDAIHLSRDLPDASNMRRAEDKMKYVLPYAASREMKILFKHNKK